MRKRILFKDEEISHEIERRIKEEHLKAGDRLPSERQMAEEFGVQRETVRCALDILLKKGEIVRKPRHGYYVAQQRIVIDVNNLHAVKKEIEDVGIKSRSILLSYELVSINKKLSERMHLPQGTLCCQILRIRYDDEKPISLERSYVNAAHVPGLSREDLQSRSLTSILRRRYGITLVSADQRITQVYPDDMEAELLRVDKNEPLIRYEGLMYDRKGRLIELFDNTILPGSMEFRIRDFA